MMLRTSSPDGDTRWSTTSATSSTAGHCLGRGRPLQGFVASASATTQKPLADPENSGQVLISLIGMWLLPGFAQTVSRDRSTQRVEPRV